MTSVVGLTFSEDAHVVARGLPDPVLAGKNVVAKTEIAGSISQSARSGANSEMEDCIQSTATTESAGADEINPVNMVNMHYTIKYIFM